VTQFTLDQARRIIDAAFAKGAELKLKPLCVAVLDAGGHLKAYCGQDGYPIIRPQIAQGKAYAALAMGAGNRRVAAMAKTRPEFVQALNGASGGKLIPVIGGVLIRDQAGHAIGAVGISGDTSENDEACAVAGIEAVGFKADIGD